MKFPSPGNATWSEIGKVALIEFVGFVAIYIAVAAACGAL